METGKNGWDQGAACKGRGLMCGFKVLEGREDLRPSEVDAEIVENGREFGVSKRTEKDRKDT